MAAGTLIGLVGSVLILILIGLSCRLTGLLKRDDADVLNNVIIYLGMPALIFMAIRDADLSPRLLAIPLAAWAIVLVCLGLAFAVGRALRLGSTTFGAFLLVAALGNTGYLGYPLTLAIFGQGHLAKAVFYDVFGTALILMTLGLVIAARWGDAARGSKAIHELLTFPPLLAVLAGFVLRPVALPVPVNTVIGYLAGATVPLIMLSIGLSLDPGEIVKYRLPIAAVAAIKLVVAPLLALATARVTGLDPTNSGILVLQASMPAMTLSLVIGLRYKLDTEFIPAAIFVTTLLAAVTIPAWQLVARF